MIDTTKLTAEWLAGFFDGEGCVSIRRVLYHGKPHGWALRVNITQADLELLSAIAVTFGATYGPYRKTRKTKLGKESTVYEVGWCNSRCKPILEILRRHCVRKIKQIEVAIDFVSTFVGSGYRYDDATRAKRESLVSEVRRLNGAGPYKPATETNGVTN